MAGFTHHAVGGRAPVLPEDEIETDLDPDTESDHSGRESTLDGPMLHDAESDEDLPPLQEYSESGADFSLQVVTDMEYERLPDAQEDLILGLESLPGIASRTGDGLSRSGQQ